VLLLLLSDQGSELVRIGTEQQHSALLHIMLASLPAAYAFVTLLTGWLFNLYGSMRLTRSTDESIRYKNYAVFVFALVIPAIVLIFFPVSKIQIVVGASLLFFSFFLTNLVTHRIQEKRLAGLLRRSLEISLLLALIIGIFGLWLLASIPNIAAIIGTLGVTIAALSVWAAAITILFGLLPARFGWSTKYGVFALIILIAAITSKPNEIDFKSVTERALTLHEESGDRRNTWWAAAKLAEWSEDKRNWYQADQRHNRTAHISNWLVDLASRETTRTGPVGIYLVSAEGGGLRAAVWTVSILARLHKKSNGMITQNTLAYSGVSGGSLGIGVFLSCLESLESNRRSGEVQQCTNTALNNDFLAHGVARVLITEPFKLIPVLGKYIKSRDRVFEENIESSVDLPAIENRLIGPMSSITTGNFQAQLQHQNTGAPKPDIPQYEREYPPMPPPIMPGAIVMFNATDAWTGTRIVFSNVTGIQQNRGGGFGTVERIDGVSLLAKDSAGVPVSFAIHASARFPLFSPPGIFKQYAIVDGG
jgi:MFS family permease